MRSLRPHLSVSHISRYARLSRINARPPSIASKRFCSCTAPKLQEAEIAAFEAPKPTSPNANFSNLLPSLYKTTPYSPGSPIFTPEGAHIFNRLISFLRAQYPEYGFEEVQSPTIYKKSLWEVSGHWENYAQDMFAVHGRGATGTKENTEKGEDEEYGLKPMNCPGHCLLFASEGMRSHKQLPVRYADFSPLHRNENAGSLSGLTRVRRFHQDDGHIFCTPNQIGSEIKKQLDFVRMVYNTFNLPPFELVLSTKPTDGSAIGSDKQWETAETHLYSALEQSGQDWSISAGDGAFYGPKIDILVPDPANPAKKLQTATIQLDFNLPERFKLKYKDPANARAPPVLIHRAIYGSIERFMHLLLTNYGVAKGTGALPFWLNPRPIKLLSVTSDPKLLQYLELVRSELSGHSERTAGPQLLNTLRIPVDVDVRTVGIPAKIATAYSEGYAFVGVIGHNEMLRSEVTVRVLRFAKQNEEKMKETAASFGLPLKVEGRNTMLLHRVRLMFAKFMEQYV